MAKQSFVIIIISKTTEIDTVDTSTDPLYP